MKYERVWGGQGKQKSIDCSLHGAVKFQCHRNCFNLNEPWSKNISLDDIDVDRRRMRSHFIWQFSDRYIFFCAQIERKPPMRRIWRKTAFHIHISLYHILLNSISLLFAVRRFCLQIEWLMWIWQWLNMRISIWNEEKRQQQMRGKSKKSPSLCAYDYDCQKIFCTRAGMLLCVLEIKCFRDSLLVSNVRLIFTKLQL